jgi:CII-binding regulator of phage lambda lysogenization HflD
MKRSRVKEMVELFAALMSHLVARLAVLGAPETCQLPPRVHRVRVIRLDAIGDFILWIAAARARR